VSGRAVRVGFVGLGTMGHLMAAHLVDAGHELAVHDIRPASADRLVAAGARWAASPREAASGAELLLTSLPGPREVEAVALGEDGLLAGAAEGAVYADLSTSSVALIRRLHGLFGRRGVAVLDAPVSGGPGGARSATLQIMVGGDEPAFERARPVLAALGSNVTHLGPVGAGTVAKLVHNMVNATAFQALAEGFTLGVKAGIDPARLLEAVRGAAFGQGLLINHRLPDVVFQGDFDNPRFALALLRKDVGLATELGRELGVPMALAALTEQELIAAVTRGWGARDAAATFLLQEERAGVTVRRADG
jgi:3-hydroxyisobutyrate dehydrogenase-like beta-hydroxyacid dehydrogenase